MRRVAWGLLLAAAGCGGDAPGPPPSAASGPLEGAPIHSGGSPAEAPGPPPAPAPAPPPAPAPAPSPAPAAAPTPAADGPPTLIAFKDLEAWQVHRKRLPDELPPVPEALTALDGKPVSIAGYVLIDRMGDDNRILTAMFIKHLLACCFGQVPKLNEWVHLEIAPDAEIEFNLYRPARIEGTFLIGPHSTGEVSHSLFRIVVTKMVEDPEYRG